MFKTLFKKQMFELNVNFFYNRKTGKQRSKASSILFIALYVLLMAGIAAALFGVMSFYLCKAFVALNLDWLYFALMSIMAVAFGVFGSVFNTFSGLYKAKDNDLLLSMPIPVKNIICSRLGGVYLMGLMFSGIVIVPAIAVYFIFSPFRVSAVIGAVLLFIDVSLVVLVLSCVLGWGVAKISNKLKNKSFITVIVSLAFFAVYYIFYFKLNQIIQSLIKNAVLIGEKLKSNAYPLYIIGKTGAGDFVSGLIFTVSVALLTVVTYFVLEKTFIKIATASNGGKKAKFKGFSAKKRSVNSALLAKEFNRFTQSPNYMLNCGLGVLLLPILSVVILIKGKSIINVVSMLEWEQYLSVFLITAICLLASMNDIVAPSVSLEGKNIWLLQSLPINPWSVLKAKMSLQLILTGIPVAVFSICAIIALKLSLLQAVFCIVTPLIFVVMSTCFGLFLGLKNANLTWTNEIIPIKQSASVFVSLFGCWGYSVAIGGGIFLFKKYLGITAYLIIVTAITLLLSILLYVWLKKCGTKVFSRL